MATTRRSSRRKTPTATTPVTPPAPAARSLRASDPLPPSTRVRKNAPPPPPDPRRLKVMATQTGYFGEKRRREGDVFTLKTVAEFSQRWMVWVDPRTRERITTGAQALRKFHDEAMRAKSPGVLTDDETPGFDPSENPLGAD
jgi:hypothetical protein